MEPVKLSPFHEVALQMGALVVVSGGWLVANHYANIISGQNTTVLLDESYCGKIMIQGRAGAQAVATLGLEAPVAIGRGHTVGNAAVYRLRADQLFVSLPPGYERDACAALTAATTDERITVTDVTHGRAQLRLVGPRATELLSRLCGLDLSRQRLPNHSAHQTSVAKTTQLVIRADLPGDVPSYVLIGARSLGEYLWRSILAAGEDLGIQPIGRDDLTPSV